MFSKACEYAIRATIYIAVQSSQNLRVGLKNISKEIYAKNIGMVYRNFLHWEFQRVNNSYTGYGVTYTLIDHN